MYQSSEWEEGGWGGVEEGEEGCRISITRLFRPTSLDATDATLAIRDHPHIFQISDLSVLAFVDPILAWGYSYLFRPISWPISWPISSPISWPQPTSIVFLCKGCKMKKRKQLKRMFIYKFKALQYNVYKFNTMQCNVYKFKAMQWNAMPAMFTNAIQPNAFQCIALLCSSMQCLHLDIA